MSTDGQAMHYTLTSHGETLGRTGAELPGLAPGARGWQFIPAPAFDAHRAMLRELQDATSSMEELMPTPATLASVREEERDAFVRNALMSDPRAPRFLELMDAMEALALELHDADGALVPTRTLGVTELELDPRELADLLRSLDAEAGAPAPLYLLVAGI